jgi:hypothetical protein
MNLSQCVNRGWQTVAMGRRHRSHNSSLATALKPRLYLHLRSIAIDSIPCEVAVSASLLNVPV